MSASFGLNLPAGITPDCHILDIQAALSTQVEALRRTLVGLGRRSSQVRLKRAVNLLSRIEDLNALEVWKLTDNVYEEIIALLRARQTENLDKGQPS